MEVVPRALETEEDQFLQAAARAVRPRPHWLKGLCKNQSEVIHALTPRTTP